MIDKINIIGNKYDLATVIGEFKREDGKYVSKCICDCGNSYEILSRYLKKNSHNSCGCKKPLVKDEVGKTYGRLRVISKTTNSRLGDARFKCLCECGKETVVHGSGLRSGHTKSCGCLMIGEKLYYGHGLYSKGKYTTSVEGKLTKEFTIWAKMLERCYRDKCQEQNPTYKGCVVSENFKNFQFFAEWCNNQVGFGNKDWDMDKDIIGDGKVYSEDTCCFVPKTLNLFIATLKKKKQGALLSGVAIRGESFRASIKVNGKKKHLGSFKTQQEAHLAYLKEKLLEFDRIITELSEVLTETTTNALWKAYRGFEDSISQEQGRGK